MLDKLIDTLRSLGPRVWQQGAMPAGQQYPDRFFTYWNTSTADHKHYDNATHGYVWEVDVNCYATRPDDVTAGLEAAREALLLAGWKINGKGHAVASDHPTHTGRGFTAKYLEQ